MPVRLLQVRQGLTQIPAVSVTLQVTHSTILRSACNGCCSERNTVAFRQLVRCASMVVVKQGSGQRASQMRRTGRDQLVDHSLAERRSVHELRQVLESARYVTAHAVRNDIGLRCGRAVALPEVVNIIRNVL